MANYVEKYARGRLAKLQLEAEGPRAKLQLEAGGLTGGWDGAFNK